MSLEHEGLVFNLLDTPGHQDSPSPARARGGGLVRRPFDAAPIAPKAHRGADPQLFEVCRLRDVPIIPFVNKLDREGRDPFDLLDEIERALAVDITPASWPIRHGARFPRHL
jgi:peptide chain release factor 3